MLMRWLSSFLACQHLNSGTNLRECGDQSSFKVQAVPVFRFDWTPGYTQLFYTIGSASHRIPHVRWNFRSGLPHQLWYSLTSPPSMEFKKRSVTNPSPDRMLAALQMRLITRPRCVSFQRSPADHCPTHFTINRVTTWPYEPHQTVAQSMDVGNVLHRGADVLF
jgi:hypothetical protein